MVLHSFFKKIAFLKHGLMLTEVLLLKHHQAVKKLFKEGDSDEKETTVRYIHWFSLAAICAYSI